MARTTLLGSPCRLAGWINQQQRDVIFTGSAITTVSPTIDITVRQAAGAS
jgi:hypothetical protein